MGKSAGKLLDHLWVLRDVILGRDVFRHHAIGRSIRHRPGNHFHLVVVVLQANGEERLVDHGSIDLIVHERIDHLRERYLYEGHAARIAARPIDPGGGANPHDVVAVVDRHPLTDKILAGIDAAIDTRH